MLEDPLEEVSTGSLSQVLFEHFATGKKNPVPASLPHVNPLPPLFPSEAHSVHSTVLLHQGGSQQVGPASPRLSLSLLDPY